MKKPQNTILLISLLLLSLPAVADTEIYTCKLGKADFKGTYSTDGRITFDQLPVNEWEFMATGTGKTGVTISYPGDMVIQVNHADSFDQAGQWRSLGRLHISLGANPFVKPVSSQMQHNLRTSTIQTKVTTANGDVRVELRAHRVHDVIRLDVYDERQWANGWIPPGFQIRYDRTYSHAEDDLAGAYLSWHENETTTDESVEWPGISGRTFGTAVLVYSEDEMVGWKAGLLETPFAKHYVVYIIGSAAPNKAGFMDDVNKKIHLVKQTDRDEFISSHESWWRDFWQRSYFKPDDPNGSFTRFQAAFDIYRYYIACCSSAQRDWPVRFQNDLFRYHFRRHVWSELMIPGAVEQYQSLYGAMRTGDKDALLSLFRYIKRHLKKLKATSGTPEGFIINYGAPVPNPLVSQNVKSGQSMMAGNIWIVLLMGDYLDIWQDADFARDTLKPMADGLVGYLGAMFEKNEAGQYILYPTACGETWRDVTNSVEAVAGLRALLPRLITIAGGYGWDNKEGFQKTLNAVPELPRGTLVYDFWQHKEAPVIMDSQLFTIASDVSKVKAIEHPWNPGVKMYVSNHQMCELYTIFPAKLVLRDANDLENARKTYHNRFLPHDRAMHGWYMQVAQAACLGLEDEVMQWFDQYFDRIYVLPCGLAKETAAYHPVAKELPLYPSMQGMGTGVIPVFEMLMQDYPDELILLPCWPRETPVKFVLFSPFAGRVEVDYRLNECLNVTTERPIKITIPEELRGKIELKVNN